MSRPADLTAECLAELATRGPRYTSYPPATQFSTISEARIRRELAKLARARDPISLYAHIPFCRSLCAYCGCNVIPTRDKSRGDRYVDVLVTELALLAEALGPGYPLSELALGGGSPNFLEPWAIKKLVTAVDTYFTPIADVRRSVELDPRTTTSQQIEMFATLGFRTLSVGVQDFAERVQDAIRRHQTLAQTRWLIEHARTHGFRDINVDMVYGLPRQHEESFTATLDAVIDLAPDRIALFGYAHLPDKLPHQRIVERAGRVLDRYERASLLLLAIDRLAAAGYVHIGLDHFARPGSALARAAEEHRLARTFQGYVEKRANTILGVGVTAISTTPDVMWQNRGDLGAWESAIANRQLPVARGVILDDGDRKRRAVIERLMCDGEVELSDPSYFERELAELGSLSQLASYDAATKTIRTTPLGKLLVRNVCMVFDRYGAGGSLTI